MDPSLSIEGRCDQISHCRDKSDEEDCQLMVLDRGYKKNVAPFTLVISSLIYIHYKTLKYQYLSTIGHSGLVKYYTITGKWRNQ